MCVRACVRVCVCVCVSAFVVICSLQLEDELTTKQICKWDIACLNLKSGCLTDAKEPSLPYYLSIAVKERTNKFMFYQGH